MSNPKYKVLVTLIEFTERDGIVRHNKIYPYQGDDDKAARSVFDAFCRLTDEQDQRISLAYGNVAIGNPMVTKDLVTQIAYDQIEDK